MQVLLSSQQLADTIKVLSQQLSKSYPSLENIVFVGIQQGGVVIANDIVALLQQQHSSEMVQFGQLDITFYRDDIRKEILAPIL
ncbi:MAG: hypothetical protein IPK57_20260 [Chitinophagaceae bacterium]|nr:hypothetical protein [Chitinophagaceae bacterium]